MKSRARILVVDDNPTNLKLVGYLLRLDGHEVVNALDASEALAAMERRSPDLVLLDLQLPDSDGLTLARHLKSDTRFGRVPIVAVTARAMKGDRDLALAAGCDGYVAKPIDTNVFLEVVGQFLGRRAAGGDNA